MRARHCIVTCADVIFPALIMILVLCAVSTKEDILL